MVGASGIDASELQPSPRCLFRQQLELQWFENKKLVKRQEGERLFELFLDLLYVVILANFAEALAKEISGAYLIKSSRLGVYYKIMGTRAYPYPRDSSVHSVSSGHWEAIQHAKVKKVNLPCLLKRRRSSLNGFSSSIALEFLFNHHESEEWPNASKEEQGSMPPRGKNWVTKFTDRDAEIESVMGARLYKERWNSATRESMEGWFNLLKKV
ncbi:uncharacterized protein ATNIH1004_008027 [Aspergillus tanneri]|uniref:Uncharacterized protein n=1 Tax=Aspergillus tanneri TaxID=1220188 RepID=A0A5M9MMF4_9EURO|nr:uncharacterized protein ATNIH1004_008027 [Aspergillus tanneri]KAA8646594.1 hypothetical protein ATNIH1004_008027 [Aspergillus tanneri]